MLLVFEVRSWGALATVHIFNLGFLLDRAFSDAGMVSEENILGFLHFG